MKEEKFCPVCNGTGYEKHKYVRDDGEVVTEKISCELCGGTGKFMDPLNQTNCVKETSFPKSEMIREKNSLLDYINSDEDSFF